MPERQKESPELLALRAIQKDIANTPAFDIGMAIRLGVQLVTAQRDFYSSELQIEPAPFIEQHIANLTGKLTSSAAGDWSGVVNHLRGQGQSLLWDPTWFLGMTAQTRAEGMENYPAKLIEMAGVIESQEQA